MHPRFTYPKSAGIKTLEALGSHELPRDAYTQLRTHHSIYGSKEKQADTVLILSGTGKGFAAHFTGEGMHDGKNASGVVVRQLLHQPFPASVRPHLCEPRVRPIEVVEGKHGFVTNRQDEVELYFF